uniref:Uncharacterized protein n=1 Tax=Peronospora matthiolae TaxID=2874970 RepID=A0AAV1VPH1_9STRA
MQILTTSISTITHVVSLLPLPYKCKSTPSRLLSYPRKPAIVAPRVQRDAPRAGQCWRGHKHTTRFARERSTTGKGRALVFPAAASQAAMPEVLTGASAAAHASPELKKTTTAVSSTSDNSTSTSSSSGDDKRAMTTDDRKVVDTSRSSLRVDGLDVDRSSRPHFKEGIRLAEMGKWTSLLERVTSEPQLARHKDHHGMLPLHWACTEDDTPTKAVQTLLTAYPEAVMTKNNAQYLPIHIAVKARAPLETLRSLVDARPSSLMMETPAGKTVIQLAKEMQLPPKSLAMLQRAEQDYLDLSEDDDEAFDYENAKRDIEMQSQMLRESILHPPSMNSPNASLLQSNPIGAAYDVGATQNPFGNSQNMVTTLSFVDGALVQSQRNASGPSTISRKTKTTSEPSGTEHATSTPLNTQPRQPQKAIRTGSCAVG